VSFAVLASWFRLKYPHVAVGALASSAPILQFDYITPWTSFYDAVSQDYKVSTITTLYIKLFRKKKDVV
jgi:lysosomal Pro-X carboxypeptidase